MLSNVSAAQMLGPGLALPLGDAKAEKFAESMYHRIQLTEKEILAVADLLPLKNSTLSSLQEVLCKLSISALGVANCSACLLFCASTVSTSRLFSIFLHHHEQWHLSVLSL